ncbi:drug/metabolite transporter (DMT) superfamily domain protein [Paenibacillus macerans]|uniref:Drug/metabolite transporter (DMT) superfamily domain protein n=1 Tax=Paenibacillus macerans TaxID=44252 RepID=A0A090ZCI7_PAEMA|nr:drug/metabolite transporter (DMT) superfamily domain protein [Paenibacillus macerans]
MWTFLENSLYFRHTKALPVICVVFLRSQRSFLSSSVEKETPPVLKSAFLSTGGELTVFIVFPPTFLFDLDVLVVVIPYGLALGIFGVVLPPLLFFNWHAACG